MSQLAKLWYPEKSMILSQLVSSEAAEAVAPHTYSR